MKATFLFTTLATLTSANLINAAVINIAAGNVTASSEIGMTFDRIVDHIVNGNGLNLSGEHTTTVESNMWLSTGTGFGGVDADPFVIFDLGAVYTINSFHVWNYNEASLVNRGVNGVSVEYGITGALGSTVAGITNFVIADDTNTYTGEDFSSFTPFVAQFIKFDINTNYGDSNNFYGLSEVQFDGDLTSIPEPSSIALLGLGSFGLLVRRRRS